MSTSRHGRTGGFPPATAGTACGILLLSSLLLVDCGGEAAGGVYFAVFDGDVRGLRLEADVRCLGVPVGYVASVRVLDSNQVQADLLVIPDRVTMREDMRALVVAGESGGTYVKLTPGKPDAEPLPPGGTIQGTLEPSPGLAIEGLPEVVAKVDALLTRLEEAVGHPQDGVIADILRRSSDLVLESKNSVIELRHSAADVMTAVQVQIEELGTDSKEAIGVLRETITANGEQLRTSIERGEMLLGELESQIRSISAAERSHELAQILSETENLVQQMQKTATDTDGLVAESRESLARIEDELSVTMRQTQDALTAGQRLVELLERDPSSMIHGKSEAGRP